MIEAAESKGGQAHSPVPMVAVVLGVLSEETQLAFFSQVLGLEVCVITSGLDLYCLLLMHIVFCLQVYLCTTDGL